MSKDHNNNSKSVHKSVAEYFRGLAGGLLFSFPLLFTMEVWWTGFMSDPFDLLILLTVTYLLLLGYNRFAGVHPDEDWGSVIIESVEEMGIGLIISFGVLWMLNRISFTDMGIQEVMGKVIVEAMGVSIGVSIGTAQLGTEKEKEEDNKETGSNSKRANTLAALLVLSLCGAILVGGNVAPTEEVLIIALEASPNHLLAMALISILQSIVLVFFSSFHGTDNSKHDNLFFAIVYETCISYMVALVASVFILWFFGRFEGVSFDIAVAQVIVLSVLASLGASAGRLLIK